MFVILPRFLEYIQHSLGFIFPEHDSSFFLYISIMSRRLLTLKNPHSERKIFRQRIIVIAAGLVLLSCILLIRFAYLQLYQERLYTTLARHNLLNLLPAEPNRGLIYDRNGVLLAENRPEYSLVVTPNQVHNLNVTLTELTKILPISSDDLQQFYRQVKLQRRFAPALLHSQMTEKDVATFAVQQYRFPGVAIKAQLVRHYPLGSAVAQVVGYVGRINAHELAAVDPSNYSVTNFIGKTGVEQSYETALHGIVGYQQAETDATGKVVRIMKYQPPIGGDSLYLTIDSRLQQQAEQILGTQRGAIVAINPQNGEVLALVSNPSYDPNLFVTGISKKDYQQLANAPAKPLFNRALRGLFPPGSTVKPYMALEGLTSGTITPDYTIYDPGFYKLKNSTHLYHDKVRTGHGSVNLARAIPVSCDTYFYNLAFKLGIERIDSVMTQFGYGQPTGIDLSNELPGLIPSPEWKKRVQGKSWYPGDTLITGIGQGFMLVTPLQLAAGTAALAMHGTRIQPHVLLRSQAANSPPSTFKAKVLPTVTIENKIWDFIHTAMQNVTKSPEGTAYRYFHDAAYTVAGKTGTAQVFSLKQNQKYNAAMLPEKLRDNSLFTAFAPVQNPKIAIAVVLQNSSVPASSIARKVLDAYLLKTPSPS